jgi:eukaryotic-like serine/threonine-protein kinase
MTDEQSPDALRPGSRVGPWRVEGYAGRGSYGAVYRARRADQPRAPLVALKMALFAYDPRFLREVELLSRTRHAGVPQLLDRGWWTTAKGRTHPYLVMQWVEGQPLYEWARVHRATSRQVLQVVSHVAWALEALHRAGGLHRDVKGDNVLVEPEGRAFLTDFGSGTWQGAPPLTETLMPPGTREYRSPEAVRFQWGHLRQRDAHYEASTYDDLYALGVSAYRVVTGVYPPPGMDPEARMDPLKVPYPPRDLPQTLNPRVAPELSALIERLLSGKPEARGLAREVAEAAEAAAERAGPEADVPLTGPVQAPAVVVAPVSTPGEVSAYQWRERAQMVSMLGLVFMVVALVFWMGHEPHARPPVVTTVQEPEFEGAWNGGQTSLADASVPASVSAQVQASGSAFIATEIPDDPLPGQRRPPCRPQEVAIRGGCWVRMTGFSPPCDDDWYEYKGGCYLARYERGRPPTSKDPQK